LIVTIFERLRIRFKTEAEAAEAEWDALVQRLVDDPAGEDSDDEIAAILKRHGQSVISLQCAVDRARRRAYQERLACSKQQQATTKQINDLRWTKLSHDAT
jgi:putative heme iron utilization protein